MKSIFKGRLLELATEEKRLPNGNIVRLEIVKHPGASLIIPFVSRDRIIILKQLRPVIGSYIYEFPAGTLNKGESPLSCARREIVEETGYRASKFTFLCKIFPVPGYSTERIYIYKAQGLRRVQGAVPEHDEIIESIVIDRKEIKNLFKERKIVDAKTIAALALCGLLG